MVKTSELVVTESTSPEFEKLASRLAKMGKIIPSGAERLRKFNLSAAFGQQVATILDDLLDPELKRYDDEDSLSYQDAETEIYNMLERYLMRQPDKIKTIIDSIDEVEAILKKTRVEHLEKSYDSIEKDIGAGKTVWGYNKQKIEKLKSDLAQEKGQITESVFDIVKRRVDDAIAAIKMAGVGQLKTQQILDQLVDIGFEISYDELNKMIKTNQMVKSINPTMITLQGSNDNKSEIKEPTDELVARLASKALKKRI